MRETPIQQRQADEAMSWLLRLESETTPAVRAQFLEWCEKSRDHVQAFLEMSVLDRQLEALDPHDAVDLDELVRECRQLPAENVVPLHETAAHAADGATRASRGRSRFAYGIAAAFAVVALAGALLHFVTLQSPTYHTQVGEQRSLKLDDGSAVYLNTLSRVRVHYSKTAREVRLLEGEAYFVVAKDAQRPFTVTTDTATVLAVGTQFNVYRKHGRTTVSVIEGRVKIATETAKAHAGAGLNPIPLSAGETAQVSDGQIVKQDEPEVSRAAAWRQRELDFRRTPLVEVVAQFNRYNKVQLRIDDPAVGERLLNGVFDADAPEQLLRFLEQRNDLTFERTADTVVIRRSAP